MRRGVGMNRATHGQGFLFALAAGIGMWAALAVIAWYIGWL